MDNSKVCVFDIDGVLNYYPTPWINFVNAEKGMVFNNLQEVKNSLSYNEYKRLKKLYRESGVKSELKPREGAIELINKLRSQGYLIVIISARPIYDCPSLYKQTTDWLDSRGIQYDNLIFSDRKQFEVIKFYPKMHFMIEDNLKIANIISELGYTVYLIDSEDNKGKTNKNVKRIKSFEEVLNHASK